MSDKIKLAFIKFGGMAAGGTEKFFQNLAMNLPEDKFDITYFYCDAAPYIGSDWKHPDTDPDRYKLMKESPVKLVKFDVTAKNVTIPTHDWVETNFWDRFSKDDFDIVVSARAGHPEYPFTLIRSTPIVDTIHMPGLVDNQENIAAVVHVSDWNRQVWIQKGGNSSKAEVIYLPIQLPTEIAEGELRKELGLEGKTVFGMHQRPNDGIYSHIPVAAYSQVANENTAFLLLGGSEKYKKQAEMLECPNFHHLPPTGDMRVVCKFLQALDVYTHGRADGENNSQSIAEAMAFGKPVVSHLAPANGHVETIGNAGQVVRDVEGYADEMRKLQADKEYYAMRSTNATERFKECYNLETNMSKFIELFERVFNENKMVKAKDDWLQGWLGD